MKSSRLKFAVMIILALFGFAVIWHPWEVRLSVLRAGGKGPPTLVLLHGFASSAEHWMPFTQTISMPPHGRFLFPQAPEMTPRTDGTPDGRAWWNLDLAAHLRPDKIGIDLTNEQPAGLLRAAQRVRSLLSSEGNSAAHPFILGGFSQGAIVACQIAFTSDEPLSALVILSGTPADEITWKAQMGRRKGLPVFISHGRNDTIMPFILAQRLNAEMVDAGLAVTFAPFDGAHEMPAAVVIALNDFLKHLKQ
jgi:phospholipase/carboxylesterase